MLYLRGFILKTTKKANDLLKNSTRGYFQNSHSFERLACLWDNNNILNVSNTLTLGKKIHEIENPLQKAGVLFFG